MEKSKYQNIRISYEKYELCEKNMDIDPIVSFKEWFNFAISSKVMEPNAMVLSTASLEGKPSSRIVLLKEVTEQGLVFFTNYKSKKGTEIAANPYVSVNFFWPELERQVRIEGKVKRVTAKESDDYFYSRPMESQIGAIVSNQSAVIENREVLEKAYEALKDTKPERPKHWGGYIIEPNYFEFWQGRASRLHDRLSYTKQGVSWKIERISP